MIATTAPARRKASAPAAAQELAVSREAGPRVLSAHHDAPLHLIDIGDNVRKAIDQASIEELAASIASEGLLQPVGVTPDGTRFSLVYGQRRVLAARHLGWLNIPAVLVDPMDRDLAQLLENIQREDLNAIDYAQGLKRLEDRDLSRAEIARRLGKAPSTISNLLRTLKLEPESQAFIASGELTASHANTLGSLSGKAQVEMARMAVKNGLSAHGLEAYAKQQRAEIERQKKWTDEQREQQKRSMQQLVEDLEKKGADRNDPITVAGYGERGATAEALRQAGFTKVTVPANSYAYGGRPGPKFCDCKAWKVTSDYGSRVSADCVVDAHRKAADKASNDKDSAKRGKEAEASSAIEAAVQAEKALLAAGPLTLRLLLAELMRWSIDQWSEKRAKAARKRDRNWYALRDASDEEIAAEIVKRIQPISDLSLLAIAADLDRYAQAPQPAEPTEEREDIAQLRRIAPDLGADDIDPYEVEQAHHGETGKAIDDKTRDRVRDRKDCPRCVALTAVMDAELMGALLNGTGPFAGMGS